MLSLWGRSKGEGNIEWDQGGLLANLPIHGPYSIFLNYFRFRGSHVRSRRLVVGSISIGGKRES